MEKSASRFGKQTPVVNRVIEGCWLALLFLVPLAVVPEGTIAGAVQVPKVFVFRTIVLILTIAMVISYILKSNSFEVLQRPLLDSARNAILALRSNSVVLAVAAVLVANVIAFIFSPVRSVSWGGVDPGFDSYGLLTILSFVVIFAALVSHLKTEAQLRRILWGIALTGVIIGAQGFGQHFGFDPFQEEPSERVRLTFTFGNPLFAAAYLLMTIPLSLVLWESFRARWGFITHATFGVGIVVLPLFGIAYSLSRGAIISLTFALAIYFTAEVFSFGLRSIRRPAAVIAISLGIVMLLGFLPTPGNTANAIDLRDRVGSIGESFTPGGGGLSGRYSIWSTAMDAFLTTPWVNEDANPELPGLGARSIRRVVGFGPDMFGVTYRMVGSENRIGVNERNAHNFIIHSLIELGLLGVIAYGLMAGSILYVLWGIIRQAQRREIEGLIPHLAIGLTAAFMGRLLEQMTGKAQLSDLMLMWILVGVIAALANRGRVAEFFTASPNVAPPRQSPGVGRRSFLSLNPARKYASVFIVLLALLLWWQTSLADIRAMTLSGQAQEASASGKAAAAGALYEQAIDIAPHASIPRLLLVQGLIRSAQVETDTAVALSALEAARVNLQGLLERNPLDLRAREWSATISQEIALIDPSRLPQAVHDAALVAVLSPGLWEQLEPLAWILALSGDYDQALRVVHEAQALGGDENPDAHMLYFIESKIEREQGNIAKAEAALAKLKTFTHPDVPLLVESAK